MDESPTDGFRHRPAWLAAVAGLLLAQAGLALGLFGSARGLTDDRPVTAGRHPLHLYHGTLGAQTFHAVGATACYDPAFHAGYPKTPVFDGGCRPAELFLAAAGGTYSPAAYKVGLFLCVLLVPAAFVLAARGVGLPAGAAVLAGAGGVLLAWSPPARGLLDAGDLDVFAAGLCGVAFIGWLGRYARDFGIDSWAVLAVTSALGWYAHPLIWAGLVPVVALFYLAVAPRHGLAWHLGLMGVGAAGLAPNLWWLWDWGRYWWLRLPGPEDAPPLPGLLTVLGTPSDYLELFRGLPGGGLLLPCGLAGIALLWRAGDRVAAGLLLLSATLTVFAARLGLVWPPLHGGSPDQLVPLAAGFLAPPAALVVWRLFDHNRLAEAATITAVVALLAIGWLDGPSRPLAGAVGMRTDSLPLGLTADQDEIVKTLAARTTPDARVLWDDPIDRAGGWNWTALLPVLTGRSFVGGLDPDPAIEHGVCGLRDGRLNGRPLGEWTDADLGEFCRWYNVGWVAARSPAAVERWGRFPPAKAVASLSDGGQPVVLFELARPRSFVLSGSARWESAGATRVSLADVIPDANGYVELSLHHMAGLRAFPSYVRVESEADPFDPIGMVRLKMPGPVPQVTLMWENQ